MKTENYNIVENITYCGHCNGYKNDTIVRLNIKQFSNTYHAKCEYEYIKKELDFTTYIDDVVFKRNEKYIAKLLSLKKQLLIMFPNLILEEI